MVDLYIYKIREISFNTSNQQNATDKHFSSNKLAEKVIVLTQLFKNNLFVTQKLIPMLLKSETKIFFFNTYTISAQFTIFSAKELQGFNVHW